MKTYNQILNENKAWAEEIFAKIDKKLSKVAVRSRNILPAHADENGMHIDARTPFVWTNGFFGGLNLLLYAKTGNPDYLETARMTEKLLDRNTYLNVDHDVGFMWHLTSTANYRLTGDEQSKDRAFHAAAALMSRFVISGDYIRAWNNPQCPNWTIIDTMMNLPLLYWASDEIGDDRFKRVAMAHADMAMEQHVRPDGSVIHIAEHDRDTGVVLSTHCGQGCAIGSSWSRGQAWALYGFVISYIHTGEERYLNTAKLVANYFISACCDDWKPRVDFRAPAEPVYYDSSAGLISACGLIELAKALPECEGGMYMNAAINFLRAVDESFADYNPENDTLVTHGTVRYPVESFTTEDAKVHCYLPYGDFYYTEAILKILGAEFNPW